MSSIKRDLVDAISRYSPPVDDRVRTGPKTKVGSLFALAKATGVQESSLSRFMSGESGLSLDSVEALCKVLKLELTLVKAE